MNILFVGMKDMAARYTAEKMFKEDNNVFWLTESSEGTLWNDNVDGNIYRTDTESKKCKDIFRANNIDVVIFLTGTHREYSDNKMDVDYKSIIPGLMNILKISKECNVKKFVLFSSILLCKENIDTPILSDLRAAETLCESWSKNLSMPILIVRISSIYGVDDFRNMDYTGYVYRRMILNESIYTILNNEDEIDLIYGKDVAEAIYRLIKEDVLGRYDLCNGHTIKAENYFKILSSYCKYDKEIIFNHKFNEKKEIKYDSSKIKDMTGWMPFYDFTDNIADVLKEAEEFNRKIKVNNKSKLEKGKNFYIKDNLRSLGENILLFIISCILLNFTENNTDFRFVDVRLMYVVIIACIYGMRQSMIAALLACMSYGYALVNSGSDLTYLLYSMDTWMPFVMYLITGSSIGYITDSKNDKLQDENNQYKIMEDKYTMLKEIYEEVCDIKNQLQRQILVSKNSFWHVYQIIRELDTFKPELIFFKAINILEDVMETNSVSIYTVNPDSLNYARLMANSTSLAGRLSGSLKLDDYPLLKESIKNRKSFVNKELLEGYPTYAAPIIDKDKVVAIAMTYNTGFEKFTIYYQNLFNIIIQMIQSNLVKAYKYTKAAYEESYIPGTTIYNSHEFKEHMRIIQMAKEEIDLPYIVCKVLLNEKYSIDKAEFSRKICSMLRNTDFVGCDENNNYYVVLMQTNSKNIDVILKRFKNEGIEFEMREAV